MKRYENLQVLAEKAKPLFLQYYKKIKASWQNGYHCAAIARWGLREDWLPDMCQLLPEFRLAIHDKDIERMAKAFRIKPSEVVSSYLRIDEDGDYVFKSMPCPFLMNDNGCLIYESRPKACREYPHTDRKNFEQIYKFNCKKCEYLSNCIRGSLQINGQVGYTGL